MAANPEPVSPAVKPSNQSEPSYRKSHQPPPMREVTKGWFTMRERPQTVEELQQANNERR